MPDPTEQNSKELSMTVPEAEDKIDPRFESAWQRVALAGRELGSGPQVAAERIAIGVEEWLRDRNVPELNALCIATGVAVGLVMAADPDSLATLKAINEEWRQQP